MMPKLFCRKRGALREGAQFLPGELRMDSSAEPAIRAGDDVFASDDARILDDPVRDELWMLQDVGRVADHARDEDLARGSLAMSRQTFHSCS